MFEGIEAWAIVAIAIAVGLFGVLAVQTVLIPQQAEAACQPGSIGFNASQGRCFRG